MKFMNLHEEKERGNGKNDSKKNKSSFSQLKKVRVIDLNILFFFSFRNHRQSNISSSFSENKYYLSLT